MNQADLLKYLTEHPWQGWMLLGVISLVLSRKSQVDAWAHANPRVAGLMKLGRSLGIDPWMALQSVWLIVFGKLPTPPKVEIKQEPPPQQ